MMWAFGDTNPPDPAAVALMDSLLTSYLLDVVVAAMGVGGGGVGVGGGGSRGRGVRLDGVMWVVKRWRREWEKCRLIERKVREQQEVKTRGMRKRQRGEVGEGEEGRVGGGGGRRGRCERGERGEEGGEGRGG